MYDTEEEITRLVEDKEGEMSELREQIGGDFDLYTLAEYEADTGYESYTSSAPRNFFDKVNDGINKADISIQIKLPDDATEKERKAASIGEQYLWGALAEIDRNFRGSEPPLRNQVSFHECLRGWVAVRALVYTSKDKTVFDVLIWDILHTTWERGKNGLLWAANKRKLSKAQVKAEYGLDIKGKDAELIDWWDEDRNAIIVESRFAKPPKAHNIGHPPIFISSVGSMPTLQTKEFESTLKYRGDSVWSTSRNLYKPMNKITSRTMDRYERSIVGSIVHTSPEGKSAIAPGTDPYRTFQEIKLKEGEKIEPLLLPTTPPETAILHSIVDTDISQSTLPYPLSYGGTRQAMSGAALSVLVEGTRSVFSPRTDLLEQVYTWLCEELLSQYKEGGIKTSVRGFEPNGKFFSVKIKPNEINTDWYIVVSARPKLPRDRQAEILMSLSATQKRGPGEIPLLSKQTAREDIMEIKDPDAEQDKIYEEMGEALEPIMIAKIVAALKERGKEDLAQDVLMLLSPPGQRPQPQMPPELLAAAIEVLGQNPQTQPLAQAMMQAMQGGQVPPGGQGPPTQQGAGSPPPAVR